MGCRKNRIRTDTDTRSSAELEPLIRSLMIAFNLDSYSEQLIKNRQQTETLEEAIQLWLLHALVTPDKQLGSLMIPTIATRFHRYIESLRREQ